MSAHKKFTNSCKESDKNLALFLNASDGIAIVNENGNLFDCSDSFGTMLGYSRAEIIGMHASQRDVDLPKDELMNFIHTLFQQNKRVEF
ncbi:MAG: PAS domain-containing protein [Methylococcaceae bacterium]